MEERIREEERLETHTHTLYSCRERLNSRRQVSPCIIVQSEYKDETHERKPMWNKRKRKRTGLLRISEKWFLTFNSASEILCLHLLMRQKSCLYWNRMHQKMVNKFINLFHFSANRRNASNMNLVCVRHSRVSDAKKNPVTYRR